MRERGEPDRQWSSSEGPWHGHGIAVVGMAGRFPRAASVEDFWRNLLDGRDCIARLSREELLADGVAPATIEHERFVPAGAVLDDIELFDAAFFGISPREAESMDPQQRLFLEVVQHALEDAGIDPARPPGPIGIYAGARLSGYWLRLMNNPEFMSTLGWHQVAAGNDKDFLPTQASFRFNLRGPSVNVQSACSTSMLAVALGCDALVAGHCHVAIAGAASIAVPQRTGYVYQPGGIASPDGLCRPFDAGANGSVLGNGVACVVLKRADHAIAEGDRIYAVIRGIAVNNDGSTKTSFAAPSVRAQAEVVSAALSAAGVSPSELGYIEAHGTATALGDPIEIAALSRVFQGAGRRDAPCGIGSVKGNVGHLDPVAGVAGLIKAALCLHHGELPASIHFEHPNPAIDFAASGLRVVTGRQPWPRGTAARIAAVSSFGIGGTNVHAVLEEAPAAPAAAPSRKEQIVVLSARTPEALQELVARAGAALRPLEDSAFADAAFTLACGRREFRYRRFVVAGSGPSAAEALAAEDARRSVRWAKDRGVVFLFPGQGGQHRGMGGALYRAQPVFRAAAEEVFGLAAETSGLDLRAIVEDRPNGRPAEPDVQDTAVAQPLLFAVEYASARLWQGWGVQPAAMLGHSVGELVAAHLAGVLSLRDAVRVVCERGRLMQQMPRGAMVAVTLEPDAAKELETDEIRIAAFNSPRQHTLSGPIEAIDELERQLQQRGVEHQRLTTSHAFHHPSMAEAAERLLGALREVRLAAPRLRFVSSLTGDWITAGEATSPEYWARSIVAPVRFSQGARTVLESPSAVLVECGVGRALSALVRAHGPGPETILVGTGGGRGERRNETEAALEALGTVWQSGVEVDWPGVWRDEPRRKVSLPPYPFQRQRHWIDATPRQEASAPMPAPRSLAQNCYSRAWLPAPSSAPSRGGEGTWFVLLDRSGLGQALCDRLREAGGRAIGVVAGARFQVVSDRLFCVDPESPESLRQLVEKAAVDAAPVRVVNCWTADVPPGPLSLERGRAGLLISLMAPVELLQALSRAGHAAASVHTIASRAFAVTAGEPVEPVVSPALGLTRVLPQEVPGLDARLIDVAVAAPSDARTLVEQLATELLSEAGEPVIAYRGGARLCETFAPTPLPQPDAAFGRVRAGGTYLVTGGFGGIGGVLAKLLATAGHARLALVGRRGLEEREGVRSPARELVRELEALEASVLALSADISDRAEAARVVREVEKRFGAIHGVVHAAGVAGGGMLMVRDAAAAAHVLAAKVQGTIALLEALAPHRPDFIAFCSSFAAIGGGVGQGDYCAGNAFLDAAAAYGRSIGLRTIAINWPAWREVGMVEAMSLPPELEPLRLASLASGIVPTEGMELFARILAADLPNAIIPPFAPLPLPPPADRRDSAAGRKLFAPKAGTVPAAAAPKRTPEAASRPPEPADYGVRPGDSADEILVSRLASIWSSVLGVRDVGRSDDFFALGGQSLMALQLVTRVREQFPVEVGLSDVFDHPTLGDFGAVVHERLEAGIAALPDEEVRQMLGEA